MTPIPIAWATCAHCGARYDEGNAMAHFAHLRGACPLAPGFDAKASAFYMETGMLPPGKDDPRGEHNREERAAAWEAWLREREGGS